MTTTCSGPWREHDLVTTASYRYDVDLRERTPGQRQPSVAAIAAMACDG
jgi:hypothetical protein